MYGNNTGQQYQVIISITPCWVLNEKKPTLEILNRLIHACSEVNVLELTSILEDLAKAPTG